MKGSCFLNTMLVIVVGLLLVVVAWFIFKSPFSQMMQQSQESSAATASASSPADNDAYALATHDGSHVRWNPCEGPISVRIYYGALAPDQRAKAKAAVAAGLRAAREATGLEFDYRGATKQPVPTKDADDRRTAGSSIVIGFQPARTAMLMGSTDDVGIRRALAREDAAPGWRAIVGADIQVADDPQASLSGGYLQPVLTGLAVAMGMDLTPVATPDNLLSGAHTEGLTAYGPGDRAGLQLVGATLGCLNASAEASRPTRVS